MSAKKVLIINSPLFKYGNDGWGEDYLPPIGLGYIATELLNQGVNVELIDAIADSLNVSSLLKIINAKKPSHVALNVFSTNYELVKEIVESIEINTTFIIGGLSTGSIFGNIYSWKTSNPIYIVHGDGEKIVPDILNEKILENPTDVKGNRKFYKVINSSKYFVKDISMIQLKRHWFKNEPVLNVFGEKEANIITSRGCIYNCAFCAAAKSLNKEFAIREKTKESVIKEIAELVEYYPGLKSIRVLDDLFLKNKFTIRNSIETFNRFNLIWRSMAHILTFRGVEEYLIEGLRKSGCFELFMGIESGSPEILWKIHKNHEIENVVETITKLFKHGINLKTYFIYGFPDETKKDFEMTYRLACRLKEESIKYNTSLRVSVFQFRPYHGTEIYHQISEKKSLSFNKEIGSIKSNNVLNAIIGRSGYNFYSGNYSTENIEIVHEYINRTLLLNNLIADKVAS